MPLKVPSISCIDKHTIESGAFKIMEMVFKTPAHPTVAHLAFNLLNNLSSRGFDYCMLIAAAKCNCPVSQTKIKYEASHHFAAFMVDYFDELVLRDAF